MNGEVIGALIGTAGATLVVLALAWVTLTLIKKAPMMRLRGEGDAPPSFVHAVPVGQRERVTVVRYREEIFMLGVTPGGISVLARFPEAEASNDAPIVSSDSGGMSAGATHAGVMPAIDRSKFNRPSAVGLLRRNGADDGAENLQNADAFAGALERAGQDGVSDASVRAYQRR